MISFIKAYVTTSGLQFYLMGSALEWNCQTMANIRRPMPKNLHI